MKNKPNEIVKLMESWHDKMPEQANLAFDLAIYGKHILSEDVYNDIMKHINVKPRFDTDTLESPMFRNIDFDSKDYTMYDMLYTMNRLYMIYGNMVETVDGFVSMAKACLEDKYYPGDPSEKAFIEAEMYLKKH